MKLCKDCKHFKGHCRCGFCLSRDLCSARPAATEPEFDPVDGREVRPENDPREMRSSCGFCGPDAKLFEQRQSIIKRIFG